MLLAAQSVSEFARQCTLLGSGRRSQHTNWLSLAACCAGRPKLWAGKAATHGGFNHWDQVQCVDEQDTARLKRLMGVRSGPAAEQPVNECFAVGTRALPT